MEKIYAQSTRKNRTLQSATSQLQGIFGTELTYPELQQSVYPVNNFSTDRLILTESSNCQRYAGLQSDVTNSPEWANLFNVMMPEKLEPNLYSSLRQEEPSFSDYGVQEMSDVATYISWAQYHGI